MSLDPYPVMHRSCSDVCSVCGHVELRFYVCVLSRSYTARATNYADKLTLFKEFRMNVEGGRNDDVDDWSVRNNTFGTKPKQELSSQGES